MLTLLHSFLESYIDPYFAEIVYNWNELVLSIIGLSLIHISEPTRPPLISRMPSSA